MRIRDSKRDQKRIFLVLLVLISLGPAIRFLLDWREMRSFTFEGMPEVESSSLRGFDWIVWEDIDGQITATYVFPRKFAEGDGIIKGDVLFQLNYQQYFQAETVNEVVQKLRPGESVVYSINRDGSGQEVVVELSSYPTLMYPLSDFLWGASMWGFVLAFFIHVIALIIALPLAVRSRGGWYSSAMILASGLWISCGAIRIGIVNFIQPEFLLDGLGASIFNGLTVLGLGGWLLFPALLAKMVLHDQPYRSLISTLGNLLIFLPGTILFLLAVSTGIMGTVGPLSLEHLIAPILFYVCCYVAGAILAYLLFKFNLEDSNWSKGWSIFIIIASALAALVAIGLTPYVENLSTVTIAWIILFIQLLGVAPILLISFATLRYGKPGLVLTNFITKLFALVIVFFLFIACVFLWRRFVGFDLLTQTVFGAMIAVAMVPLYNRIVSRISQYVSQFLFTERQKGRQKLSRFTREIIDIPTQQQLVDRTIVEIGESLKVSSAVMYLHNSNMTESWLKSNYRPSYPYITENVLEEVWPAFARSPELWARNAELNENTLDKNVSKILEENRVDLIVPITDDSRLTGLLILGERRESTTVYNLEDVDLLRTISSQVAVAVDRQRLFQREKELARQTSQAELAALRAQINPHFLFNTLNAISSLIEEKPDQAVETVNNLSSIFRYTLKTGKASFASIEDEVQLVRKYLSIEKVRFGDRLSIEWQIDDGLKSKQIPALALQTIVENSIVHGISKIRSNGKLRICIKHHSEYEVLIEVEDNGPGIPSIAGQGETSGRAEFLGLGTSNVFSRLSELYGRDDLLRFESRPGDGTIVRIFIPKTTSTTTVSQ